MLDAWKQALLGGVLIGFAASLMLLWNGRVTGISGILGGCINTKNKDRAWRGSFLVGLVFGGFVLSFFKPESFSANLVRPNWAIALSGFLVGFGTLMGGGCTSGHGVCGLSRFSLRSLVATLCFMGVGILTVLIFKQVWPT